MAKSRSGVGRRKLIWGSVATSAAVAAGVISPGPAQAHITKPGEWKDPLLQSVVGRPARHKVVFSNANVEGPQLVQIRNWLNAMQFSYQTPPDQLLVVAAFYGSSNVITYNDIAWNKYRFGEKYGINDPTTGKPALRNIFQPRAGSDDGTLAPDDPKSLYQEATVEALQKRGVIFFT